LRRGLIIICELAEIRLTIPRKKASIKEIQARNMPLRAGDGCSARRALYGSECINTTGIDHDAKETACGRSDCRMLIDNRDRMHHASGRESFHGDH